MAWVMVRAWAMVLTWSARLVPASSGVPARTLSMVRCMTIRISLRAYPPSARAAAIPEAASAFIPALTDAGVDDARGLFTVPTYTPPAQPKPCTWGR